MTEENKEIIPCVHARHSETLKSIGPKIIKIMAACRSIEKDMRNKEQSYDYASAEAVVDRVNQAMVENGVVSIPVFTEIFRRPTQSKNGTPAQHVKFEVIRKFIDPETMEWMEANAIGETVDYGDKAAGKAQTIADKICYKKFFNIASKEYDEDGKDGGDGGGEKPRYQAPERKPQRFAPAPTPPPAPTPKPVAQPVVQTPPRPVVAAPARPVVSAPTPAPQPVAKPVVLTNVTQSITQATATPPPPVIVAQPDRSVIPENKLATTTPEEYAGLSEDIQNCETHNEPYVLLKPGVVPGQPNTKHYYYWRCKFRECKSRPPAETQPKKPEGWQFDPNGAY